ncbi:hypothetical protein GLOTRDRAFT_110068 [Gloeophyllum trabeum ATCC 11539]|uniref:Uncharacterized protein n=1 Tax=Gloeophyllum trabeum (strain ATCC 11539 / FP-39264 / Madison 617) TaxID=670483 RepID=S7QG86_GLOTA|nr:uncharacterized protein GLOTRDRAFT_110068 [Gloeophyllum trabeum ATCC 11539]EPQ58198.1 hypothetical protein GLOTRDRAFT_110068 [Gloeophyllum trabeum ATCC 11539]
MSSPVFLRVRGIAFTIVSFTSLVWIVLLCLEIFLRWDVSDPQQRSFAVLLLIVNTITIVMLPLLILTRFRVWLDAARLLFLLMAHIGVAVAYVAWTPKFHCPDQTPDQQGVCMLVNMYILIASWVNPAFLLTYAAFLIIMVLRSPLPLDAEPTPEDDLEKAKGRASTLPLQGVGDSGAAPTSEIRDSSQRLKDLLNAVFPDSPATAERDSTSPMRSDNRKSASSIKRDRLSKPLPASYFYNQ